MFPKQFEIEIPLLRCLKESGGKARPQDIYARINRFFPNLTETDLAEPLPTGGNKWKNRIQWVRQRLVSVGEMASPEHGVWAITEKGGQRLGAEVMGPVSAGDQSAATSLASLQASIGLPGTGPTINLEEVADEYFSAFKEKVLQKLLDLTPKQLERFVLWYLRTASARSS